jgi:phage terminase small subunit
MGLSLKQARFVAEYLVDLNATQAAIRAGYSRRTANEQGARLLAKASISHAVQERQAKRLGKLDITADRVLAELARIGFSDIREWFDETGRLKPLGDLGDNAARALASVKVLREKYTTKEESTTEETVIEVKAWDKVAALDKLARHLGLLKDRIQFEGIPAFRVMRDDSGR